ncbi:MAG: BON domain-containing protein [Armatimonadetes bacterium]|nr:BON domain-containing protein [Armatimonadota bacterium]
MRKLLAILGLGLWLSGCPAPPPAEQSIRAIDHATVQAVKISLQNDMELAPQGIKVEAKNDMVVLNGTVPSEAAKKRAERIAKRVQGVEKVANHLVVAEP